MFKLRKSQVHLQQDASTKGEALLLLADKMMGAGLVDGRYVDGIMAREALVSSYVGNGVAIPHALPEYRQSIKSSGIMVAQFPSGVDWGYGNTAYLLFAIAAFETEHLRLLSQLACVLENAEVCKKLIHLVEAGAFIHAMEAGNQL